MCCFLAILLAILMDDENFSSSGLFKIRGTADILPGCWLNIRLKEGH